MNFLRFASSKAILETNLNWERQKFPCQVKYLINFMCGVGGKAILFNLPFGLNG